MRPKTICPIFAEKSDLFISELQKTDQSGCDYIEIRLDRLIKEEDWLKFCKEIVQPLKTPVIATIRTSAEGGEASLNTVEYCTCIESLFALEDILVDVELPFIPYLQSRDEYASRMILSKHYFDCTPDNLKEIWEDMERYHPFIQKIACMPQNEDDVARLLISCYEHKTSSQQIAISMSKMGTVSRIAGFVFGSGFTFTTFSQSSAPGQISLEKMNDILDLL